MPPNKLPSGRRPTRGSTQQCPAQSYPPPFQQAVNQLDTYARNANLRPLIYYLPFTPVNENVPGIRLRLARNRSFATSHINPHPEEFPSDLQPPLSPRPTPDEAVDSIVEEVLSENRAGLMILLVEPPEGIDYRGPILGEADKLVVGTRPVCGVILRIGPRIRGDVSEAADLMERAVISAFVRRSVPDAVARELMHVCLLRAILEGICYEEAAGGISGPERDRRFVTVATADLFYCPSVLIDCLRAARFTLHWDSHSESVPAFRHDEQVGKGCSCNRRYRKDLEKLSTGELARSKEKSLSIYQFWMLTAKQLKAALERDLLESFEDGPSREVLNYCKVEEETTPTSTTVTDYKRLRT